MKERLESIKACRGGVPKTRLVEGIRRQAIAHGRASRMPVCAAAVCAAAVALACTRAGQGRAGPQPLTASSPDYSVRGEYERVPMDRVDGLRIANGRAVLNGAPADRVVDLPGAADPARPGRRWALVTDAHVDGHRLVTFTESESVKDVSIELPDGEAPVRFAVFAARAGDGEVLVFATGDRDVGPQSLYGHIVITPK